MSTSEAQRQREHYAQVRARLTAVTYKYDPEAQYQRGNRKLHAVVERVPPGTLVEKAKHEIVRDEHKRKARLQKQAEKARTKTSLAAAKRIAELRTYEEWEKLDADQKAGVVRPDGNSSHDGALHDASKHDASDTGKQSQFTPKASAQGFREWLKKHNAKCLARHTEHDDTSAAQGNGAESGQGQPLQDPANADHALDTCDASNDASGDIK